MFRILAIAAVLAASCTFVQAQERLGPFGPREGTLVVLPLETHVFYGNFRGGVKPEDHRVITTDCKTTVRQNYGPHRLEVLFRGSVEKWEQLVLLKASIYIALRPDNTTCTFYVFTYVEEDRVLPDKSAAVGRQKQRGHVLPDKPTAVPYLLQGG